MTFYSMMESISHPRKKARTSSKSENPNRKKLKLLGVWVIVGKIMWKMIWRELKITLSQWEVWVTGIWLYLLITFMTANMYQIWLHLSCLNVNLKVCWTWLEREC